MLKIKEDSSSSITYRTVLKVCSFSFCALGFSWICLGQMRKWLNEQTNVATSWRKVNSFEPPELIFCLKDPFRRNASSMFVSKDLYDTQNARYSDIPVTLSGNIPKGTTDILPMKHETGAYYTFYNGKCKSFAIKEHILPMDHVEFRYPKNLTDMKVYLLAKGDAIALISSIWVNGGSNLAVHDLPSEQGCEINVQQVNLKSIPTRDRHCEEDKTMADFFQCVVDHDIGPAWQTNTGLSCFSVQYHRFLSRWFPNVCENKSDIVAASDLANRLLIDAVLDKSKNCRKPCLHSKLTAKLQTYKTPKDDPWHYEYDNSLYLTYLTDSVVEESEYLVYDMVGIVSALGGGLGMFLGFSLLHIFDDLIRVVFYGGRISEVFLRT